MSDTPQLFDFTAIPSLKKTLVLELARCEYIARRENVIAVGNSGTGKTQPAHQQLETTGVREKQRFD
jgi:DNA replication protein DnaC